MFHCLDSADIEFSSFQNMLEKGHILSIGELFTLIIVQVNQSTLYWRTNTRVLRNLAKFVFLKRHTRLVNETLYFNIRPQT